MIKKHRDIPLRDMFRNDRGRGGRGREGRESRWGREESSSGGGKGASGANPPAGTVLFLNLFLHSVSINIPLCRHPK